MPVYTYLLQNSYSLAMLGELPLAPTEPYTRLLTGCGAFGGSIPLDHAMATRANFKDIATNGIVLRDDDVVWFGPTVSAVPNMLDRTLELSFREPTIWWQMRTIEVDKNYHADLASIARKLWTYVTTKTDSGGINAALSNITLSNDNAGVIRSIALAGAARHYMQDVIDWMAENDTGLEYRCDYSTGTSRLDPHCTIKLGAGIGSTKTELLTEHATAELGRELDWNPARSATRTHAIGAGFTATKQNTGSIAAGVPLMELVLDRSNLADHDLLNDVAREARRKAQPPVQTYDATFTPTAGAIDIDTFDPGDTVPFDSHGTDLLTITGVSRRIVEIAITPETDQAPEAGGINFNLPLSDLGV